MNQNSIREICGLIAESRQDGDLVSLTIGGTEAEPTLTVTNAPSYVLDAITDNGYFISVKYGSAVITAEEA
jgi:hypothetical protein